MGNVVIPQPGVPYVIATIGSGKNKVDLTNGPDRRLLSFEYTQSVNRGSTANSFTLNLVDSEWTTIETALYNVGVEGIDIQYGWYGSDDPKLWTQTPISLAVQKFTPKISEGFVKITIIGLTKPKATAGTKHETPAATFKKSTFIEGNTVSDIIKKIYGEKGYDTSGIQQTAKFAKVHCDNNSTMSSIPTFIITGQTAQQIWNNELRFKALEPSWRGQDNTKLSKETDDGRVRGTYNTGRGGYSLYFVDSNPPKVFLSIVPPPQEMEKASVKATYDYPINHGGSREVIDFTYDVDFPIAASTLGQEATRGSGIDPHSGVVWTAKTQQDRKVPTPKGEINQATQITDGFTAATSIPQGGLRGRNPFEAADMLKATYFNKSKMTYRGSINLLGRPDYELGDNIQMNVWARYKDNTGQLVVYPHYASGKWNVREIVQVISPGTFTTKLDLQKVSGMEFLPQSSIRQSKGQVQNTSYDPVITPKPVENDQGGGSSSIVENDNNDGSAFGEVTTYYT